MEEIIGQGQQSPSGHIPFTPRAKKVLELSMREALQLKENLAKMMAKNTGQKLDKVKADMERDFWMSAEEAVKYGVADEVIKQQIG